MKRLLIDTNIILDILAQREPFYQSAAHLLSLSEEKKISLFVSSLSIVNTNYVLSKFIGASEAKSVLRKFRILIEIASLSEKIIDLAMNDNTFRDFEDAVQYYSAVEMDLEGIITRDLNDFKMSKIPVMSSQAFINSFVN